MIRISEGGVIAEEPSLLGFKIILSSRIEMPKANRLSPSIKKFQFCEQDF